MKWTRVTVSVKPSEADNVSTLLKEFGSLGIEINDYTGSYWPNAVHKCDEIPPDIKPKKGSFVDVIGYLNTDRDTDDMIDRLFDELDMMCLYDWSLSVEDVDDQDWAESWKRHYKPQRLGKNIVIVPTWLETETRKGDIVVKLDPGMAFGTGDHPTTRLSISLLEEYLEPGCDVLDIGTGSGILSVVSALLGAKKVDAVDIDPVAINIAKKNIACNDVDQVVSVYRSDLIEQIGGQYDLVIANIIADVILKLLPESGRIVGEDGLLIVSGIIESRIDECVAAVEATGYHIAKTVRDGEWTAMALTRNAI